MYRYCAKENHWHHGCVPAVGILRAFLVGYFNEKKDARISLESLSVVNGAINAFQDDSAAEFAS
jgi:hypothetical protein